MEIARFLDSLADPAPPAGSDLLLQALWHDARGDWQRSHEIVQSQKGGLAAAVHAYLHRKEGDLSNAGYWYTRAGRPAATGALQDEWDALAAEIVARPGGG